MKIRFISDIHYYFNVETAPTELFDIMSNKKPADITLIAGDMSACIEEAYQFLEKYFKNEKVVFVNGNHCVYNKEGLTLEEINNNYKSIFNDNWKYLENDYVWLNEDIAVIGCIGWTDFMYGFKTKSEYVKKTNAMKHYIETHSKIFFDGKWQEVIYTDNLPDNPAEFYEESKMGDKKRYRAFKMRDALRGVNDYNYGKMKYYGKIRPMTPQYTYKLHKLSMKMIKKCYNEIVSKNPNATIILLTHHPFVKNCVSERYKNNSLNSAFVSNHNNWLKQFPNIKYLHCGHVHQRFIKTVIKKQLICNPMGYIYYGENNFDKPFDINLIFEI